MNTALAMVAFGRAFENHKSAKGQGETWQCVTAIALAEAFDALPAEQSVGVMFDQNEKDLYDAIVEARGMVAVDAKCEGYLNRARECAAVGLADSIVRRNTVPIVDAHADTQAPAAVTPADIELADGVKACVSSETGSFPAVAAA